MQTAWIQKPSRREKTSTSNVIFLRNLSHKTMMMIKSWKCLLWLCMELYSIPAVSQICRHSRCGFYRANKLLSQHCPCNCGETIRSLNYCRRKGERSFIGCAQLLYIWIQSHFWGKCETSLKFCMSAMIPVREFC